MASLPSVQMVQGEEVACETEKWHCSACGAEWMSPAQATAGVVKAVAAFQTNHGLLTADDCRARRKSLDWTQDDLATESGVGIATVKRLESGVHVIAKLQNDALERAFAAAARTCVPDFEISFEPSRCPSDWAKRIGRLWLDDVSWSRETVLGDAPDTAVEPLEEPALAA